jgi:hypothetical protein
VPANGPPERARPHALLGFGRLAWLRGDRDHAVELLEELVPMMRRLGDQRCTGRGLYLLGERAREQHHLARAEELLRGSAKAAVPPARRPWSSTRSRPWQPSYP